MRLRLLVFFLFFYFFFLFLFCYIGDSNWHTLLFITHQAYDNNMSPRHNNVERESSIETYDSKWFSRFFKKKARVYKSHITKINGSKHLKVGASFPTPVMLVIYIFTRATWFCKSARAISRGRDFASSHTY